MVTRRVHDADDNPVFPILMKEMRSRMRGKRAPMLLLASAGAAVAIGLGIGILALSHADMGNNYAGHAAEMAQVGELLFGGIIWLEMLLVSLIAPALTAGAIAQEHEQQTFDFLALTRLSAANIVISKLLSSLSLLALVLLATLPVSALAFVFGGVSIVQFLLAQLLLAALAVCFGAFGLACSARFQRTTIAAVVAYATCAVWVALSTVLGFLIILLLAPAVPTFLIARLVSMLRGKRLARVTMLCLWGGFASLALGLLYLPSIQDYRSTISSSPIRSMHCFRFLRSRHLMPHGSVSTTCPASLR